MGLNDVAAGKCRICRLTVTYAQPHSFYPEPGKDGGVRVHEQCRERWVQKYGEWQAEQRICSPRRARGEG